MGIVRQIRQIDTDIDTLYRYHGDSGPGYRIHRRQQPPSSMQTHHDDFLKAVRNSSIAAMMFAQRRDPSGQTKKRTRRFMLSRPAFLLRPLTS